MLAGRRTDVRIACTRPDTARDPRARQVEDHHAQEPLTHKAARDHKLRGAANPKHPVTLRVADEPGEGQTKRPSLQLRGEF